MGNKSASNNSNSTKPKDNQNLSTYFNLESKDMLEMNDFRNDMMINKTTFDSDKFCKVVFYGIDFKYIDWLNAIRPNKKIKDLCLSEDLYFLVYMLTSYNYNDDDQFELYQRKNIVLILYDIHKGTVTHTNDNIVDIDSFLAIVLLAFKIFHSFQSVKFDETNEDFLFYIVKNSLEKSSGKEISSITMKDLLNFCQLKLCNLDSYLRMYFSKIFLNHQNSFATSMPVLEEKPNFLLLEVYFCFCLMNPHILHKINGFCLHECSKHGYNVSSIIKNIVGFTNPVTIFISTIDNKTNKEVVLGLFMNSDFKETFESSSGDDNSMIFAFNDSFEYYRPKGSSSKYCYLLNTKNLRDKSKRMGIGMGKTTDGHRVWLDNADLFKASYFKNDDDVYAYGSPYNEYETALEILNIEVIGFGSKSSVDDLKKRKERDLKIGQKMRQIDKSQFCDEFTQDVLLEKTFQHRQQKRGDD